MERYELAKKIMPPNTCGYNGVYVRRCSFVRDGCGYRFKKDEGPYCPHCGLDRYCYNAAIIGRKACKTHAPWVFKRKERLTAKLTRRDAIPENLRETYEASLEDPGLMELTRDLALSEALIIRGLERISEGDPGEMWASLQKAWKERKKALREASKADKGSPRREAMLARISELEDEIEEMMSAGADEWQAFNRDVPMQLELRRRLVMTEYQRLERLGHLVAVEKFVNFSNMLAAAVIQHAPQEVSHKIFLVMSRFLEEGNYKRGKFSGSPSDVDYRLIEGSLVEE